MADTLDNPTFHGEIGCSRCGKTPAEHPGPDGDLWAEAGTACQAFQPTSKLQYTSESGVDPTYFDDDDDDTGHYGDDLPDDPGDDLEFSHGSD
jgi:hypothetical protein